MARACAFLIALVGSAAVAAPDEHSVAAARLHFDAGRALYLKGRHRLAIAELEAGYRLDPRPEFLADLGQAHRALGELALARGYYRRFIDETPADSVERRNARIEALLLLDSIDRQIDAPPAEARSPPTRRWYSSQEAWLLVGAGNTMSVIGAALFGALLAADPRASSSGNAWSIGGGSALLAIGGGLSVAGLAWFIRADRARCAGRAESSDEACSNAIDDDCDGATDCADPSCDGRRCGDRRFCMARACAASCRIDGRVLLVGATLPGNPCLSCDPARLDVGWTPAPDGTRCAIQNEPGSCRAAGCCTGCWDGASCHPPTATCSVGGGGCASCAR